MSQRSRLDSPRGVDDDLSPNKRAMYQTRIAALKSEIKSLEAELKAAEQRTEAIVDQYEQILEARTSAPREADTDADPDSHQTAQTAKERVQQFLTR
ncbi:MULTISPECIES: hypothetical protein [unclassified Haladaptatus]|uniref:hypothetical protein n=1 Tax=unclassified Haladaptatus TaxID=2622732 RepID=UPI0023E8F3D6|nr:MULTISPECIES: hypothetical protein [unclassified Haladaptatus]